MHGVLPHIQITRSYFITTLTMSRLHPLLHEAYLMGSHRMSVRDKHDYLCYEYKELDENGPDRPQRLCVWGKNEGHKPEIKKTWGGGIPENKEKLRDKFETYVCIWSSFCFSLMAQTVKHVLLLKFKDSVSESEKDELIQGYQALPSLIPHIKAFEW